MKLLTINMILLLSVTAFAATPYPQQAGANTPVPPSGTVSDSTNIHYTGKYCDECHEKKPAGADAPALKYTGDYSQLCRCHSYKPGEYTHPVDIIPSDKKKAKIPSDLPLDDGKLSCRTCHDIHLQCTDNVEFRFSNKRFLRGAPYQKRTELCFRCHDDTQYRKLDPHNDQIDENGDIVASKCLYCHLEKPDELRDSFGNVKLLGDILILCQRCHSKPLDHPANANHMVLPPLNILTLMKKMEKQFDVTLPLDYDGKISCPTCHNPHQRGVIPAERFGARGASEENKQRLPGKICMACHVR